MRRVRVVGNSGAGKTTLARRLAAALSVPHLELDAVHHRPGWTEATVEQFQADLRVLLDAAPDGWVADGNYRSKVGDLLQPPPTTARRTPRPCGREARRAGCGCAARVRPSAGCAHWAPSPSSGPAVHTSRSTAAAAERGTPLSAITMCAGRSRVWSCACSAFPRRARGRARCVARPLLSQAGTAPSPLGRQPEPCSPARRRTAASSCQSLHGWTARPAISPAPCHRDDAAQVHPVGLQRGRARGRSPPCRASARW